jgi:hypothetical protein
MITLDVKFPVVVRHNEEDFRSGGDMVVRDGDSRGADEESASQMLGFAAPVVCINHQNSVYAVREYLRGR